MMASAAFLFTVVMVVVAVTTAVPQPDTPLPPVIPFKSLPRDLITQDPYADLHAFREDHHNVLHNQIPRPFGSRAKDTISSKFPSFRFPSISQSSSPLHQASSFAFSKPSIGASSFGSSVSAKLPSKPAVSFPTLGALDKVDGPPHVDHSTPNHFPSLGYDLDSYFTGFPAFGFFDFNPDRAGVTTRTHLPPFPHFPEDIPLKDSKGFSHAPPHAPHHAPRHAPPHVSPHAPSKPTKPILSQVIHHNSFSGTKHFRTRLPRRAVFFPSPPAMPSYPKTRTPSINF